MMWKMNATVIHKGDMIVLYGKQSILIKHENNKIVEDFLKNIQKGLDSEQLDHYSQHKIVGAVVQKMKNNNLIVPYDNRYTNTPLERTYDFFCHYLAQNQKPMEFKNNIHITILGCGGIGACVSLSLLLSGFSRFTLVDYDLVEMSNLNRQFPFTVSDVGKPKTTSLKNHLKNCLPSTSIDCKNIFIDSPESLSESLPKTDLIVSAIDTPPIQASITSAKYARSCGVPIFFGSVGYDTLRLGPFLSGIDPITNYIKKLESSDLCPVSPIRGSLPTTNSMAAAIISNHVLNYFYSIKQDSFLNKEIIMNPFSLEKISEQSYEN